MKDNIKEFLDNAMGSLFDTLYRYVAGEVIVETKKLDPDMGELLSEMIEDNINSMKAVIDEMMRQGAKELTTIDDLYDDTIPASINVGDFKQLMSDTLGVVEELEDTYSDAQEEEELSDVANIIEILYENYSIHRQNIEEIIDNLE